MQLRENSLSSLRLVNRLCGSCNSAGMRLSRTTTGVTSQRILGKEEPNFLYTLKQNLVHFAEFPVHFETILVHFSYSHDKSCTLFLKMLYKK